MLQLTKRSAGCWAAVAIVLLSIGGLLGGATNARAAAERTYSDFLKAVTSGGVVEVTIDGENLAWRDQSGSSYSTTRPNDPNLIWALRDNGVTIKVVPEHGDNLMISTLLSWLPMILLIGVWTYFMRRMRPAGFGKFDWIGAQREMATKVDEIRGHLARIEGLLTTTSQRLPPQGDDSKSGPSNPAGTGA